MDSIMLLDFFPGVSLNIVSAPRGFDGATARGGLWQAAADRFLLDVPDVGRYQLEDGVRITIEPSPLADDVEVSRF